MTKTAMPFSKSWIFGASWLLFGLLIPLSAAGQQPLSGNSVVGRWSFSSPAQQGAQAVAGFYTFTADGRAQLLMAGGIGCIGGYQFDGQSLAVQMSACQTCMYGGSCMPAPDYIAALSFAAPVQFQGPYALVWLMQPPIFLHRN